MSFRILLVDPDSLTAAAIEQSLVQAGYRVAAVGSFGEATRQMSLDYPDLLVTKVRLGAFNGLHLLLRCRAEHPDVPVIIAGASVDRTDDMTRFEVEFVTCPIDHASFLELVGTLLSGRTAHGPTSGRRRPRKRAVSPAMVFDHSARTLESRCGDLPLEIAGAPDGAQVAIDIGLPLGLSVNAISGARRQPTTTVNSGAGTEMARSGSDVTRRWRGATRRWHWMVGSLN